jgi:hypothetical protein
MRWMQGASEEQGSEGLTHRKKFKLDVRKGAFAS